VSLYALTLLFAVLMSHRAIAAFNIGRGGGVVHFCMALALGLGVLAPGFIAGWRAVSLLREGLRVERWREEQVDALRRKVDRPIWAVGCLLLLVLMVSAILFTPRHSIFFTACLSLLLPINLIGLLQSSVRKPVSSSSKLIDWTKAKPVESEHWGHTARP
jgi:hypothetical protein